METKDMATASAPDKNGNIRAVERAIDLLRALNLRPASTLGDLHHETGLPKSSIVRLLRTLETQGLVRQSFSYGTYQLLGRIRTLSCGFHHEPPIIAAAEGILRDFTEQEGWPLALALFDHDAVVVRACTMAYTSLSLESSLLDRRLSLVSRALGRAYLAYSTPSKQKMLIEILKHSKAPEDQAVHQENAIARMIMQVRERGYATRDPLLEPRSSTMAVPVYQNDRVIACLGLTWITAAMPLHKAVDRYLEQLRKIASSISDQLATSPLQPGCSRGPAAQA